MNITHACFPYRYIDILERSKRARLQTGMLFAKLIERGTLPLQDYCTGLEEVLAQVDDLIIDIPKIWDYLAEILRMYQNFYFTYKM